MPVRWGWRLVHFQAALSVLQCVLVVLLALLSECTAKNLPRSVHCCRCEFLPSSQGFCSTLVAWVLSPAWHKAAPVEGQV